MIADDPRDALIEHLPAMRAFAISLTRDSGLADDVVQDTLVKAWSRIDQFDAGTNMRAWLFTILRNTSYSERRKSHREVPDVDGIHTASLAEKPAHDGRLNLTDFRAALAELSDEQREALLLVGASGFSYEEAAAMCKVPVGTVKSRIGRARHRLSELLDLNEDDTLELTDDTTVSVMSAANTTRF